MKSSRKRFNLNEEQANYYIIYFLEKEYFWDDIHIIRSESEAEWLIYGVADYNDNHKFIKFVSLDEYIRLLQVGIELKKGFPNISIDILSEESLKFRVSYDLEVSYGRRRKK